MEVLRGQLRPSLVNVFHRTGSTIAQKLPAPLLDPVQVYLDSRPNGYELRAACSVLRDFIVTLESNVGVSGKVNDFSSTAAVLLDGIYEVSCRPHLPPCTPVHPPSKPHDGDPWQETDPWRDSDRNPGGMPGEDADWMQ